MIDETYNEIPVFDAVETKSQYRHKKTGAIYKTSCDFELVYSSVEPGGV